MDRSQLWIVPATQVSGDGVDTAGIPFQLTLSTLSQAELLHFLSQLSEFFRSWSKLIRLASVSEILLHPGSPEEENYAVASSSRSTPINDTTNLFARSGIFTLKELQSLLRLLDWKMEVGKESLITRDNDCRRSLLAVPSVDHRLRRTGFYLDSFSRFVSDASRHHRQSNLEDIRTQPMPYTRNNNGKNRHGLGSITNKTISFCWRQYSFL